MNTMTIFEQDERATVFGKITAETILSLLKGISRLSADERAKIVDDLWETVKDTSKQLDFFPTMMGMGLIKPSYDFE